MALPKAGCFSTMKNSKIILWLFILTLSASCNEDTEDPRFADAYIKTAITASMQEWYYWNDQLPQRVDYDQYNSYEALLEAIKYKPFDRWSYLTTPQAFDQAFTGQNSGHGFGWAIDQKQDLYLSFVYSESPAGKDGWQRGWKVIQVNGKPVADYKTSTGYNFQLGPAEAGISNSFTFELPDGSLTNRSISKAAYQANSVLNRSTISLENKRIGYLAYNSFKATAGLSPTQSQEVKEAFDYFEKEQVDEMIVDLRYNGGGSVRVAEQLMNYLAPISAKGQVMYTDIHNRNKEEMNGEVRFTKTGGLDLSRIFFIVSGSSASASELSINCLSPYMEVKLIGQKTYGKPVGAFPVSGFNKFLENNGIELVPITFSTANANGKADYFEGLPVDYAAQDGVSFPWADPEEPRLNAALQYIRTGSFPINARQDLSPPQWEMIDDFTGLQQEFPVY